MVYGFKMNCMRKHVLVDSQVKVINSECVVSDIDIFKSIDCGKCTVDEISNISIAFQIESTKRHKVNWTRCQL